MSIYKYTKDGKKVIVIGQLNNQETIVQEIFIVEGQEIPGGENFVVIGLLDKPGVSWKENKITSLEERYTKADKEYDNKMDELRKKERIVLKAVEYKLSALSKTIDNISMEAFDMVGKFLRDEYKYVVESEYAPCIKPFAIEENMKTMGSCGWDNVKCDGIKLITLLGSSEGNLNFRLNQYRDGSGGGTKISLFVTLEEAKEKLVEIINSKKELSEGNITELKKWGIEPDKEKYKVYMDNKKAYANKRIEECKDRLKEAEQKLIEVTEK